MTSIQTTTFETFRDTLANSLKKAVGNSVATVKATPEEKMDYKPTESAKSVRELAQHILEGNGYCLQAASTSDPATSGAQSKEELVAALEASGGALAGYAAGATEETFGQSVTFFGREFATPQFLSICEWHISRHTAQIDYLQTTWGDMEDHS